MDYGDFLIEMARRLQDELGGNYEVRVTSSKDSKELMVLEKPAMEGFTVNAEKAYDDFMDGESIDSLMIHLKDIVHQTLRDMPRVNPEVMENYNRMLRHIRVKMLPKTGNEVLLQNAPHIDILDMAAEFRVVFSSSPVIASVVVTNRMLEKFDVTPEKFTKDALQAGEKNSPVRITNLGQILGEMEAQEPESYETPLVFAGNDEKFWGAGVIAYPSFMETAAETIGGSFFLLPSSIHEVLLLPDNGTFDGDYLKQVVRSINTTQVDPEEVLTNNAYHYDAEERVFDTVDHYKEVQKRRSVLKELHDSRKTSAKENNRTIAPVRGSQQRPFL